MLEKFLEFQERVVFLKVYNRIHISLPEFHRKFDISVNYTVKKQFRLLAFEYHPDMESGDAESFKTIREAYDIVMKSEKFVLNDHDTEIDILRKLQDAVAARDVESGFIMWEKILKEDSAIEYHKLFPLIFKLVEYSPDPRVGLSLVIIAHEKGYLPGELHQGKNDLNRIISIIRYQ